MAHEALLEGSTRKRISVVTDGEQAIDFVRQRGEFRNAPRPDLVLLDLNLPKRDGLEVLQEIKSDAALHSMTVIVLTTSQFEKDITAAYELLANCYIVKPADLEQYYSVMRGIEEFWMTLASLPTIGKDPIVSAGGSRPAKQDTAAKKSPSASGSLRQGQYCNDRENKPQMNADERRFKTQIIRVYLRSSAAMKRWTRP